MKKTNTFIKWIPGNIYQMYIGIYAERGVEIQQEGGNSSEGKQEEVFLVVSQERRARERRPQQTKYNKCIFSRRVGDINHLDANISYIIC